MLGREHEKGGETDPKPQYSILFWGYPHHNFDIKSIRLALEGFEGVAKRGFDRNVLYLEGATNRISRLALANSQVEEFGSFAAPVVRLSLASELGRNPTMREIRKRQSQLGESSLDEILSLGLIKINDLAYFFLLSGVDRLKAQGYNVSADFEAHSNDVSDHITSRLLVLDATWSKFSVCFNRGDFQGIIDCHRSISRIQQELSKIRDKRIADAIKERIRKARKDVVRESLFMVFGSTHHTIGEKIASDRNFNEVGEFKVYQVLPDHPSNIIHSMQNRHELIPAIVYARSGLYFEMMKLVEKRYVSSRRLQEFGENYETIAHKCLIYIKALDLQAIKDIVEQRKLQDLIDQFS